MAADTKRRRAVERKLGAALLEAVELLLTGEVSEKEVLEETKSEGFDEQRFFALAGERGAERAESALAPPAWEERAFEALSPRAEEKENVWAERGGYAAVRSFAESVERDARRYDGGFDDD